MDVIWVGIDVSKQRLDVAIRPVGETLTVSNNDAGIKALIKKLRKWSPQLIVLEATGGHEYASAYSLMKAGLPVAVVNPRQVRDLRGRSESSPKRIPSMRRSWHTSVKRYSRRYGQ